MINLKDEGYNPDVLCCLANLSNDEVFTPPEIANKMLDLLPQELFRDPTATFLDPACKSGVFLREIARRLIVGLQPKIPDLQERLDHIFHKQLYGIAITQLTSLLSRRSLYCSKFPNSKYSVSRFDMPEGNIRFRKTPHTWKDGKCVYCGASQREYDRDAALETHAYEFIHVSDPKEIFKMKFDVIIGNPPYQLGTAGEENGAQAKPIYHKFVTKAKRLNPKHLVMIIPARWYTGGWGLDEFRDDMIGDGGLVELHDFTDSNDCFPGVQIKGGVCYFHWSDIPGPCVVHTHSQISKSVATRTLREQGVCALVRFNESVSILHKVQQMGEETMDSLVSAQKPFGIGTAFRGSKVRMSNGIKIYQNGGVAWVSKKDIVKGQELISKYKVLMSAAYGAGEEFPHQILNKPILAEKDSCCSETYVVIGESNRRYEMENLLSYVKTRFFRFMVMILKNSQHALKKVYSLVPIQDFSKPWTDKELYDKYGLSPEEIAFIESMIRPME